MSRGGNSMVDGAVSFTCAILGIWLMFHLEILIIPAIVFVVYKIFKFFDNCCDRGGDTVVTRGSNFWGNRYVEVKGQCFRCGGTGEVNGHTCRKCGGTGRYERKTWHRRR